MDFDTAFAKLIDPAHEGTKLDLNPKDRGNWTGGHVGVGTLKGSRYGISAASYPNEDIANMTPARSAELYRRDFWGPVGCDAVPEPIKFDLFDMAVNSGPRQAVKTLQRAVGTTPDGLLGAKTLQAAQSMSPDRVLMRFNAVRLLFMTDLAGWAVDGKGWARRIAENQLSA